MNKTDFIKKLTDLFADCESGIDAQLSQVKSRIISDLTKYQLDIIDFKRTISDIIDVINIDKATDNNINVESAWRLQSIARDAQSIINHVADFIDANKSAE